MAAHLRVSRVGAHLSPKPLSAASVEEFERRGFLVLRGALCAAELELLAAPVRAAYESHDYEASAAYDAPDDGAPWPPGRYPAPGNHCLGSRILDRAPEVLPVSADHPLVLGAAEQLLGEAATLSQFQVYMRTPGAKGTGEARADNVGAGVHYDYKPWRPVGSFVGRWLFAVIPLVDYSDGPRGAGPLLAAEGSHAGTTLLPGDGRVHRQRCAAVPGQAAAAARLVDPQLRAGDVLLMHGNCWHEAWPNRSAADRVGVYLKYHAASAPPACGPIIHPAAALARCRPHTRASLLAHTRSGGAFSGIRYAGGGGPDAAGGGGLAAAVAEKRYTEPIPTVDAATLVLERDDGRVLAVREEGAARWFLPSVEASSSSSSSSSLEASQYGPRQLAALQYLDAGNVIGVLQRHVASRHKLKVPWMSWVADALEGRGTADEWMNRVYGFRAGAGRAGEVGPTEEQVGIMNNLHAHGGAEWVGAAQLAEPEERAFVRMWQRSEDAAGRAVQRGLGFAVTQGAQQLAATYNAQGNDVAKAPTWLCAEFDGEGDLKLPVSRDGGKAHKYL